MPPNVAQRVAPSPRRARRLAPTRVLMGALAVLTAMAIPPAIEPPSAAASSCTGWPSRSVPPATIRVLRTNKGKVQTVEFRRYVAIVMASGEWPSYLEPATLEAGAVATKQYAWYYALKGHHRSSYVHRGKCYDVRDDTRDQLYRPERAKPTRKQRRAINATWGLSLRKRDRFFLTGYRAGSSGTCAADANGWKLFARSVEECAEQGWSRKRIQRAYYAPRLDFNWARHVGPVVTKPRLRLREGTNLANGGVSLQLDLASRAYHVAEFKVQRKVGQGSWKTVAIVDGDAGRVNVRLRMGRQNRFRAFARGSNGERGPWAYSPRRKAAIRGPVGTTLSHPGSPGAAGERRVGKARIRFTGRAVGYVAPTGPGLGKAKVLIDGRRVATVRLSSRTATKRELVWTRNFRHSKERVITVKPVDAASRVGFEGFYVLRKPRGR